MDLKGKRILVVGGAGFIGSHVVKQLCETEVGEVIVFDNFSRGARENITSLLSDSRVSIFPDGGDILQSDVLERAMEGIDGVFHLAALWLLQCYEYPRAAFDVNIRGTFNVIEAAVKNKVQRIVYSSSASVYGDALTLPIDEEHPYNNFTFYGATKIAGEHMFKSLAHRFKFEWVGLRYMNVYGPLQDYKGVYVAVMMKMLDRIEQGLPPIIYGDGTQQYDFIYVSDVARANVMAMQSSCSGSCYNIGRGIGTTIREIAELLLSITKSDLSIQFEPSGQTFVTNRIGSIEKAERDFGFRWEVDLREGLERLVEWRRRDVEAVKARRERKREFAKG